MWPPASNPPAFARPSDPTSPPETPRTASPVFNRQRSLRYKGSPLGNKRGTRPMAQQLDARATAGGPGFIISRQSQRDQPSPQSIDSSGPSDDSGHSDGENIGGSRRTEAAPHDLHHIAVARISRKATFTVEEMGNFEDGDEERHDARRPDHFEYPASDRSRSRSRNPPEIDQTVMYKLRNLDCSDSSDGTDLDEDNDEHQRFLAQQRRERKMKRLSFGSISKRSFTDSIGSESDSEDLKVQFLDATQAGSSARRLRRKLGNRQSLQFQDPPLPRIDQADEPDTTEDEFLDDDDALKELPYYTLDYITMVIDSP